MGVKKILEPYHVIVDGVMTGTNTITQTNPTNINNLDNIGIQVKWTGTPTGVISIICSVNGDDYVPLTFDPALDQPSGSDGGYLINLNNVPYKWLKVQYVNASGTGVFNAWICGKDVN